MSAHAAGEARVTGGIGLRIRLAARFVEVNGDHAMSPDDDAYVNEYLVRLEELSENPDELREHMLAGRLPLPGYIRSDGAEMVHADVLDLVEKAGGISELPGWFAEQGWSSPQVAAEKWRSYLSGQYVCLRSVSPSTIQLKNALIAGIDVALRDPRPESPDWLAGLHMLVDELDALEPPFADYDRLRFGGPVSRDTYIDKVHAGFPPR
jgi:hypothetical protein